MPKLNVPLLREVQKQILNEPTTFFMRNWMTFGPKGTHWIDDGGSRQEFTACGTAACIGGWAICLTDKSTNSIPRYVAEKAQNLLGLPNQHLFSVSTWDDDLAKKYSRARNNECRAAAAAEMIERVIQRYGEKENENAA